MPTCFNVQGAVAQALADLGVSGVDTNTTYSWSASAPDANGVVTHTMTGSDGSTYVLPVCASCVDDDEVASPDGVGGFVDNEGSALTAPATDSNGDLIDTTIAYLVLEDGSWFPSGPGADGYNRNVTVAGDGTATGPDGETVTVPAGALPGDTINVNFDADGVQIDAVNVQPKIDCAEIPDSAFADFAADTATLDAEAQAWIAANGSTNTEYYSNSVAGVWFNSVDCGVICREAPGLLHRCSWANHVEEDRTTYVWTDITPASTDEKVWDVSTPGGFRAVFRFVPRNGQGWFSPPALNGTGEFINTSIFTAGDEYDFSMRVVEVPGDKTDNCCSVKYTTRLRFGDLDVSTIAEGTSQTGVSFVSATGSHGQTNNGLLEPTFANIDTPSFYRMQTSNAGNVAGGLDIYSDSTTPINIVEGTIVSNGAGTAEAIPFFLQTWRAEPIDEFVNPKTGAVVIRKDLAGAVTATAPTFGTADAIGCC